MVRSGGDRHVTDVRRRNTLSCIEVLRGSKATTLTALAKDTGLSRPTVESIVAELVERGLAREVSGVEEGIGLRAMAQKDPLVEYQREGFDMFTAMMEGIKEESVGYLFNLEVQVEQQVEAGVRARLREQRAAAGQPEPGEGAAGF
ncbi:helix-turn-helix domain-containing protein, partial [Isoptericola sp. NPDC060257]|uniref:helix-turn-helix domain-containing protein n=1 Tax=Isoptericola sp. NPDC060257 TaxID=3347087 RepID=UPI00364AC338